MEKRDIIVILAAIIIVLIMAVVVKPMLTGQPVIFLPESPAQEITTVPEYVTPISEKTPALAGQEPPVEQISSEPTIIPNVTQSPAPPVTPDVTPMTWQPDPDNPMPAVQMTNYAEIVGKYSGTTSSFRIPTPYWEIHYNVTPANPDAAFSMDIIEITGGYEKIIRTVTWKEGKVPEPKDYRFFEGGKEYSLNITANQLKEYRINIQIPLKYIRDT